MATLEELASLVKGKVVGDGGLELTGVSGLDTAQPGEISLIASAKERPALREELARANRTWTARQIAHWLAEEHGVRLHPDHLATLLKRAHLSYKRTSAP